MTQYGYYRKCVLASSTGDNTTEIFFMMFEFLRCALFTAWDSSRARPLFVLLMIRFVNFVDIEYSES